MRVLLWPLLAGVVWAQQGIQTTLFKSGSGGSDFNAVTADASGQIYAVGRSGYTGFLVKMTPDLQTVFVADLEADFATVANSIAHDSSGNVYLTGSTEYPCSANSYCSTDALLVKVDGSSGKVLYTKSLGGKYNDAGTAVAVGPDGTIYLAGTTESPDFYTTPGALIANLPSAPAGFLARISADGQTLLASTYWDGAPQALAIDAAGNVYVTGQTGEPQPGTAGAFQTSTNLVSLEASTDGGAHWSDLSAPSKLIWVEADRTNPGVLYAATLTGLFRSVDGGVTWSDLAGPFDGKVVDQVHVDPTNGQVLYAIAETDSYPTSSGPVTGEALWKSQDAGKNWTRLSAAAGSSLQIDQTHPNTLYLAYIGGDLTVSSDGGNTWTSSPALLGRLSATIAVDAINGDIIYYGQGLNSQLGGGLWQSVDSGAHWAFITDKIPNPTAALFGNQPVFASGATILYQSEAFYAAAGGYGGNGLRRSTDAGLTWSTIPQIPATTAYADPSRPQSIFVAGRAGLFFSPDLGDSWVSLRPNMDNPSVTQLSIGGDRTIYALATPQPAGFVAKLDSTLSQISFFTCYGGTGGVSPASIAIDGAGRPMIAGFTDSRDLPVTTGETALGYDDAFVARFSADGSQLDFATLLGGSNSDRITGLTLTPDGRIVVVGYTGSADFPVTANATQGSFKTSFINGFVTILDANGGLIYSTYLGGSLHDALTGAALSGGRLYLAANVGSTDFPGLTQSLSPYDYVTAALVQIDLSGAGVTLGGDVQHAPTISDPSRRGARRRHGRVP